MGCPGAVTVTVMNGQDRKVDLGLALGVAVTIGGLIAADLPGGSRPPGPAAYAFAVAVGALLLLRRRHPVVVLLVTTAGLIVYHALGFPPIGLAVPAAAAFYSAVEAGRAGWAVSTAVALVGLATTYRLVEGDDPGIVVGYELVANAALLAAVIALGEMVRSRRGWHAELRRRVRLAEAEREAEGAHRIEQERVRIARELHDVMAHTLTVVAIHADVAIESVRDDPGAADAAARTIRTASKQALGELRGTVGVLRGPAALPAWTPAAGLDDLDRIVESAACAGLNVDVERCGTPVGLPAMVDITAHRIVQESITNVLRHAQATRATVAVGHQPGVLTIRVSDDGRGGADAGGGFGIRGMRERVSLLGGALSAGPGANGGFVVEAMLPWDDVR